MIKRDTVCLGEAGFASHILREHLPRMNAADEKEPHVAMAGEEHVERIGGESGANADGFLAAADIHSAEDLAL